MAFADAGDRRHDLPGRAVSALECIVFDEGRLDGMHHAIGLLKPFDCRDLPARDLSRERQTAQHALAIDMHCAGATLSLVAAFLCAGQVSMLSQCIKQCDAGIQFEVMALAIDIDGYLSGG
jgi:hypothetical protein